MVKVILQLYPVLRAADEEERAKLRPLGRNRERYQEFLDGLPDLCEAVDDLGLWGISSIEHHFHSEGYEVGPSPSIITTHMASLTRRVRVGQLGYTMSAQNPLRVAEDTAIIDHITKGRCFVGFSRGYQARWTNILGQHLGARATLSPSGFTAERRAEFTEDQLRREIGNDQINRDVFEEQVALVLEAWTQETVVHNSPRWQIPYPFDAGIEWGMAEATSRLGAKGEVGPDGTIRGVSVVPAPYTQPYPPVFIASAGSRDTVEYAGRMGFIPTYFSPVGKAAEYGRAYMASGDKVGKTYAFGENQALVRWPQIGETAEEAKTAVLDYDVEIYKNLYRPLTPSMSFDPANPVASVLSCGLFHAGTVADVRDQFVAQWKELPAEFVVLIYHYPHMPKGAVIRNLERFMSGVKPALDELTADVPVRV